MTTNKQQTAVEWLGFKLNMLFTDITEEQWKEAEILFQQAKEIEKEQHAITWDKSMDNLNVRGGNIIRAWDDFIDYYNTTYRDNK